MTANTLKIGEFHPSSPSAMAYVKSFYSSTDIGLIKESLASTALSGNRLCEICLATLDRIEKGKPVSDRYLLGLAWFLKELDEAEPKI